MLLTDLLTAEPGTVIPHATKVGAYWCRGTTKVYELVPAEGGLRCACKGYRCHQHCYHQAAVAAWEEAVRCCPQCRGEVTV